MQLRGQGTRVVARYGRSFFAEYQRVRGVQIVQIVRESVLPKFRRFQGALF